MRTFLAFSVLILVLCVGCPHNPEPVDNETVEPVEMPDSETPEPLIEPLVPREHPSEASPEESTGVISDILDKYAAENVPLPPIEDLVAQIDEYIAKIGESLDALDGSPRYAAGAADIVRDANALALVALAVGLAEADSKYKKSASHIIAAAQSLASTKTFEEGQKAYAALQESLTNTDAGKPLLWSDKVADLAPAMKALPNLSSGIKRVTDTERKLFVTLNRQPQRVLGQIAALAAVSQGSIPNVVETEKPDAMEKWKKYCEDFRDVAIKLNTATRQYAQGVADDTNPDYAIFSAAFRAMAESCDDCHRTFYPSAVGME